MMWPGIGFLFFMLGLQTCLGGSYMNGSMIHDDVHGVKMGMPLESCDDGKHGISVDWDPNSRQEVACQPLEKVASKLFAEYRRRSNFRTRDDDIDEEPPKHAMHICLNETISYESSIPLSGDHRPLWPKFGSYVYLPPQRWVHSLEHGAIALLYHPCLEGTDDLKALKSIVRGCLRKHVITPYRHIPDNKPYALLAFSHARILGGFDRSSWDDRLRVTSFIKAHALKGPESHVVADGQYEAGLLSSADIVSDKQDSQICPDST